MKRLSLETNQNYVVTDDYLRMETRQGMEAGLLPCYKFQKEGGYHCRSTRFFISGATLNKLMDPSMIR